jgi:hypothetical protein
MSARFYSPDPHYVFAQPTNPDCVIWRYLDLPKLVALLKDSALWFSRADLLGDPFEGTLTKATREALDAMSPLDGMKEASRLSTKFDVRNTAISCWHANEHESAAMWKQYLSSGDGVAVRSSFGRLTRSFAQRGTGVSTPTHSILVGLVNYVNYDVAVMPSGNAYWPFVHKLLSFQHEQEIRAIISGDMSLAPMRKFSNFTMRDPDYTSFPNGGESVPVDLNVLVDAVVVSPTASTWFGAAVHSLVERYGYGFPVHKSRLGEDPIY